MTDYNLAAAFLFCPACDTQIDTPTFYKLIYILILVKKIIKRYLAKNKCCCSIERQTFVFILKRYWSFVLLFSYFSLIYSLRVVLVSNPKCLGLVLVSILSSVDKVLVSIGNVLTTTLRNATL